MITPRVRLPLCLAAMMVAAAVYGPGSKAQFGAVVPFPVVFASRQIPSNGSIYWSVPADQPGVGAYSRFRVASPGQLVVRETNGTLRLLVDGANPTAGSLNLIDVNAPDVSYDGQWIAFAGLPQGSYDRNPANNPSA